MIKSGKEADVGLLDRSLPGGPGCLLAVKTFRSAEHRMFHRDAGYLEGRRIRRSRETRAMATRTGFGRELLAGQWATAEFAALCCDLEGGRPGAVPGADHRLGTDDGVHRRPGRHRGPAAGRLRRRRPRSSPSLWHDLVSSLEVLAESGLTHGDLSAYNVLVDEQRLRAHRSAAGGRPGGEPAGGGFPASRLPEHRRVLRPARRAGGRRARTWRCTWRVSRGPEQAAPAAGRCRHRRSVGAASSPTERIIVSLERPVAPDPYALLPTVRIVHRDQSRRRRRRTGRPEPTCTARTRPVAGTNPRRCPGPGSRNGPAVVRGELFRP